MYRHRTDAILTMLAAWHLKIHANIMESRLRINGQQATYSQTHVVTVF